MRRFTWPLVLALAVAPAATAARAQGGPPSATPQRPSLSFNVWTVPDGGFEIEAGGALTDGVAAVPLFLKYGLSGRMEAELGFDAIRQVDTPTGRETSVGDAILGLRARLAERPGGHGFGVAGFVKLPTADDEAGSGEVDLGATAIASFTVDRLTLDLNLGMTAIGRDGDTVGQVQGIATLGLPARSGWSPFVEAAWQRTAGDGSGGFFDAGVAYAASRRAVFDAAAGAGWSDGYPDWLVTVGWTVHLGGGR